jgi:hypothetical protein
VPGASATPALLLMCRSLSPKSNPVIHQVKLIAFVLYGQGLSSKRLMNFVPPVRVCILLKKIFYFYNAF